MARASHFLILIVSLIFAVSPLAVFGDDGDLRLHRGEMPPVAPAVTAPYNGGGQTLQQPPTQSFPQPPAQTNGDNSSWVNAFATPIAPATPPAVARPDQFTVKLHQQAPTLTPSVDTSRMDGGITALELKVLGEHDVALVVDKSSSMDTPDCPAFNPGGGLWQRALIGFIAPPMMRMGGMLTRWQFVQQQTMALARQTQQVLPGGLTLVLFSGHYQIFPHVDLRQVPYIFSVNRPGGTTNTAGALGSQIEDYFMRRDSSGGRVRPLAIAVITDGMPTNPGALRKLLVETTRRMRRPDEISVTFLQIGTERKGYQLLKELDDHLVHEGARYDIVASKPFPEVVHFGLARALLDSIAEAQRN